MTILSYNGNSYTWKDSLSIETGPRFLTGDLTNTNWIKQRINRKVGVTALNA